MPPRILVVEDHADPVAFIDAINGVREAAEGRTAEAVQLEQFCRELAHDVDILCLYPVPHSRDDHALENVCAGHTDVFAS
jgi:hypothetical protein